MLEDTSERHDRRDRGRPQGRRRGTILQSLGLSPKHAFDYKEAHVLARFISERGKIMPRRLTGLTAAHQRRLATHIKRARALALLPFVVST